MSSHSLTTTQNDILGYVFAALVAAGGSAGFIKKGSVPSLVAGVLSGAAIGYGAYLNSLNPKNVYFSLASCGFLALVMGSRFLRSGKFMPAGLISTLSLAMTIRYALRLQ